MNLTEKTVIEGIIENLENGSNWAGSTYEIENDHKIEVISDAVRMLSKLLELPLSEEILPEINPRTGLKL